ncbi:hypothetical protein HOY82DRAFT_538463 [Tuber indicum]|nr:hypothetical protein HOY82DRAFT_538463 [Tuber indicum]
MNGPSSTAYSYEHDNYEYDNNYYDNATPNSPKPTTPIVRPRKRGRLGIITSKAPVKLDIKSRLMPDGIQVSYPSMFDARVVYQFGKYGVRLGRCRMKEGNVDLLAGHDSDQACTYPVKFSEVRLGDPENAISVNRHFKILIVQSNHYWVHIPTYKNRYPSLLPLPPPKLVREFKSSRLIMTTSSVCIPSSDLNANCSAGLLTKRNVSGNHDPLFTPICDIMFIDFLIELTLVRGYPVHPRDSRVSQNITPPPLPPAYRSSTSDRKSFPSQGKFVQGVGAIRPRNDNTAEKLVTMAPGGIVATHHTFLSSLEIMADSIDPRVPDTPSQSLAIPCDITPLR